MHLGNAFTLFNSHNFFLRIRAFLRIKESFINLQQIKGKGKVNGKSSAANLT